MTVLIYGHRGWIGGQLTSLLTARGVEWVGGVARGDDRSAVAAELKAMRPDRVVLLIGRTHGVINGREYPTIDYLEQPGKLVENLRDNYVAPKTIVEECARLNIHCTYLGTGCIFSYDNSSVGGVAVLHPCPNENLEVRDREQEGVGDDAVATFSGSGYSTIKGRLDQDLEPMLGGCLVLRMRMPISASTDRRNLITKIVGYEKVCSMINSMSDLPSLLPLMVAMIEVGEVGRFNFTNPGAISHDEVLTLYRTICDPGFTWNNWTDEQQSRVLASGRSNITLKTGKLQEVANQLGVELPGIDVAIQRSLMEYSKGVTGVRMLVTGGCGFIGSHFVNAVVGRGVADLVVNVDALKLEGSAGLDRVAANVRQSFRYRFVKGDVTDLELMKRLLRGWRITHVVHFAAQSHVTRSFEESLEYTHDNVVGTHTLLESVRQVAGDLCKFIHISTDEVYGDSELGEGADHFHEQSVLCPTNPYAATKAAAELIARSYRESFGIPVVVTRGNNVYGPGQHEEKLVPRFVALARAGQKLTIEGDGSCVRAFMHVDDAVEAFLAVVRAGEIGEVYNIGCDEGAELSVMEVARLVVKLVHGEAAWVEDWIEHVPDRPYNDKRYYISNAKLRALGWVPKRTDFAAGVASLADYVRL
jgi:dTDP-glucose 4,6-dehydratase/UDP-glucose 4,6-dehydratase